MGKVEEMRQAMAGTLGETVRHRPAPAAMPGIGAQAPALPPRGDGTMRSKVAFEIPLVKIRRDPDQPREDFEPGALERLADSIAKKGLLQPISVRRIDGGDEFMIVAGERRWRAAELAGLQTITAIVFDRELPPGELLALQCIENLLRENLTRSEQAKAFRTLLTVNNWTQTELARELGISQATVSQTLDVLELPEAVRAQVDNDQLASSVASAIASKIEDPALQEAVAREIVEKKASRSEAQAIVSGAADKEATARPGRAATGKGRGESKANSGPDLKTERKLKVDGKFTVLVSVSGKKGFDKATWAEVLQGALERVRAEIVTEQKGEYS